VPLQWHQHQRAGAEASGIPSRRRAISGRGEITNGNIWEMLAYNDKKNGYYMDTQEKIMS